MSQRATDTPPDHTLDDVLAMFRRSLKAGGASEATIKTYSTAVLQLGEHLAATGRPTTLAAIGPADCDDFLATLLETRSASTTKTRHAGLTRFFGWCVDRELIERSPMAKVGAPKVPDAPVPVLAPEQIDALLKVCAGRRFEDRRDTALVRLFLDSGLRRAEMAGLTLDDLDLDAGSVRVQRGKGGHARDAYFGAKTAEALDAYLLERRRHRFGGLPDLWLGRSGRLTDMGIAQMLERRGAAAGIVGLHPHQLRHTFAHLHLSAGVNEGELMRLGGWRKREMLDRYGASAADARARDAHRRVAIGDAY